MFSGRQQRDDMVALSERLGTVENAITVVESTVGMTLPRVATLEARMAGIVDKIGRLECKIDRELQRRRMSESPDVTEVLPTVYLESSAPHMPAEDGVSVPVTSIPVPPGAPNLLLQATGGTISHHAYRLRSCNHGRKSTIAIGAYARATRRRGRRPFKLDRRHRHRGTNANV